MPRYIDADALILKLKTQDYSGAPDTLEDWTPQDMTNAEISDIEHAPTADVVERKRGKWKVYSILDYAQRTTGRKVGKCPFCGFLTDEFRTLIECNRELTNFCPNCGAQLDE